MRALQVTFLAAALAIPTLAQNTDAATMIPSQANAAGFVNAGKIFAEYGMLFDGGPLAEQLDQYVAQGLPDPRTEGLQQIGFGGTVDGFDADEFAIYVTRAAGQSPDFAQRIATFLGQSGLAQVSEEAYHGVTLFNLAEAEKETVEAKIADLSATEAIGSFDKSGTHAFAKLSIDTAAGQNDSYATKYGTQLSAADYAAASFQVPQKLRDQLKDSQLAFLSMIEHARARLSSEGGEVRLGLDGVCADEFDAELLKMSLMKAFKELRKQIPGGDDQWGFILDSVKFAQNGTTTTVSLALPEDLVKDLLGSFTGNERAE